MTGWCVCVCGGGGACLHIITGVGGGVCGCVCVLLGGGVRGLEPCAQLTSTLSTDCLVTEHMISVLTQHSVMKPGGVHSGGARLCG